MGHIQTKDRLHMGNNPLRHLAMMYVNRPTTDDPDGEVINSAQQCCACCLLFVSSISHRCVGTHMCR